MRLCVVGSAAIQIPRELTSLDHYTPIMGADRMWIVEADISSGSFGLIQEHLRNAGFVRVFEGCFLPACADASERKNLVKFMFAIIAGEYETLITAAVNIALYDSLIREVRIRAQSSVSRVLDLGCGPGLIMSSSVPALVPELLGCELVEQSVVSANARGLVTVSPADLHSMQSETFDAVLSAFVLHYESLSPEDLVQIGRLLRPGGIWAGNFYKKLGLDWFATQLGKSPWKWKIAADESDHGTLIFATKVDRL
jgi:SAM-dependent methyltransferase